MYKFKLFIENFVVYGFGGIISRIIPLIMLPIITRLMPDASYFGISDLSNTIVNFGSSIAMMGMYDAMYRMYFEKNDDSYRRIVCSTALSFTFVSSLVIFLCMIIFCHSISKLFFGEGQYAYIVIISAFTVLASATNSIISAPTRMENRRRVFLLMNTLSPVIGYMISIPLLFHGHYMIALPLAAAVSGILTEATFGILNRKWFKVCQADRTLLKPMLFLALPLVPNFLIYWVFNSCDRIMITNLIGIEASGIYSVSAKIGAVSQLIYTAFAGGWQYFSFSTMKEANQVETNSKIFEYLGIISFGATMVLCVFSRWLFGIIFPEQYLPGYIAAPYLFLSPLLLMLFQVISNQFLVVKKTWPSMLILCIGAVTNVVLNYNLIPKLGIEGASLATLTGYIVTVIVCSIVLMHMNLMVVRRRFIISSILMVCYMVLWRLAYSENIAAGFFLAAAVSGIYMYLYRGDLKIVYGMLQKGICRKENQGER